MSHSVNPCRVWTAKSKRGLTTTALAALLGEMPSLVEEWQMRSQYRLQLTDAQLQALAAATRFPAKYFLLGDEESEFADVNAVGRQMFGKKHQTVG